MIDVIINSPWFLVYSIGAVFFTGIGVTLYFAWVGRRDEDEDNFILLGARLIIYGPIWPVVAAYLVLFRLIPMIFKDARLRERLDW